MTARLRRSALHLGVFALAALLLYLALRGVDFGEVAGALRAADYRWLLPLGVVVMLSHWIRAWRWQALLEALPPDAPGAAPPRVPVRTAFYSLMIGYMVNYAAPRVGEVVRTANLAAQERLSFSSVLGTVVVERMLDVVVLLLGLGSVFVLLLDQAAALEDLFLAPLRDRLEALPLAALVAATALGSSVVVFALRRALRRSDSRLRLLWNRRLRPLIASFRDGLATLWRAPRRGVLVFSTVAMWSCYLLMAYLPFVMLHMTDPYDLSLLDAWSVMLLGAVGVAIPSPGGVGSYHYLTIQSLVHLFGVAAAPAATYALLGHAAQMLLYLTGGALCLVLQGSSLAAVRARAEASQGHPNAPDASSPAIHHDEPPR